MLAIDVNGLAKRFGSRKGSVQALAGVDLQIQSGEIFGLLGRNGAGKTTLVKILLDIVRASQGEASILGIPTNSPRARQEIGYLPEDHRFPEYLTAERTLEYYGSLSGMSRTRLRTRVPEMLELVDLKDAAKRKSRTFSKGMKQRLGLAQALIHDPRVLLLDEPTDGVDPVGRAAIRRVISRLKAEGKTVLLNSHLLSEVEQISDRVGILERGRLIRLGTLDELTQSELHYIVRTSPTIDDATFATIGQLVRTCTRDGEKLDLEVDEESDIDRVIDALRSRGVGLRGLQVRKWSLEEVFLQSVEPGEPTNGGQS